MEQRERVELVLPSLDLEVAYQDCEADFHQAGEIFLGVAQREYQRFVERTQVAAPVPEGKVPQTDFFLLRNQTTIIGRSALRHWLTPALENVGGHIGYRIRPTERRKGYGTHLLALTLVEARTLGLERVLLTCDSDNIGSRKVIEHNGGILASESPASPDGILVARYWIDCSSDDAGPEERL
jgi:predicted acetyltransferase